MAKRTTRLCPTTVKRAIVGSGFGAGLGLIGVALMATARISVHRPERLFDEVLMLMMGCCTGLALGWLAGPRVICQARPSWVRTPAPAMNAQPALAYTPLRQPAPVARVAWGN
jgi:hypothetical protein